MNIINQIKSNSIKRFILLALLVFATSLVSFVSESHAIEKHTVVQNKDNRLSATQSQRNQEIKKVNADISSRTITKLSSSQMRNASKPSSSDAFDINIYGDYMQAEAYKMLDYINSTRSDEHQLQWDSQLEELAMERSTELPVYFNADTRPNGEEGYGQFIGISYNTAADCYKGLYKLDKNEIEDTDYTHFAAAAFKADNDIFYWSIIFYNEPLGDDSAINENYGDNSICVNVKDEYLDWEAELINSDYDPQNEKNLQKGENYFAWIYVYNFDEERGSEDYGIGLITQDSRASNKQVLTIDEYGEITTKRAGYAKIQVSPSVDSGYETTYNCIVRPAKTTGLKLSPGSKAMTLRWSKIAGASGYEVYRSTSASSGFKLVKTIASGSTVKYTNGGLKAGQRYYYKVRGFVKSGYTKYAGAFSKVSGATIF